MEQHEKKVKSVKNGYMGASDIVNGTASLYKIEEKEMESALEEIYREIGVKDIH